MFLSSLTRGVVIMTALLVCCLDVSAERLQGDVNGDGKVDFADFLILAESFGETGGKVFDPETCRDTTILARTVIVYKTIRDTIYKDTLRVEGPTVYKTLRDTIWKTDRDVSRISVDPGDWRVGPGRIQYVCTIVRDVLSDAFMFPLDSDIVVRHSYGGPKVLFQRAASGEHVILLNTQNRSTEQNIFQFAHEYTHVLTNYYQTYFGANEWLDESLASMGSLYVFRKMIEKLEAGELAGLGILPGNLIHYMHQNIPNWDEKSLNRITSDNFLQWFRSIHQQMRNDAYLRDYNDIVAHNLIDIFEEDTEAWNIVRYTNGPGPNSWDRDQDFNTYLRGWYERTPARWQKYVVEISRRFGYFPSNKVSVSLDTTGVR